VLLGVVASVDEPIAAAGTGVRHKRWRDPADVHHRVAPAGAVGWRFAVERARKLGIATSAGGFGGVCGSATRRSTTPPRPAR